MQQNKRHIRILWRAVVLSLTMAGCRSSSINHQQWQAVVHVPAATAPAGQENDPRLAKKIDAILGAHHTHARYTCRVVDTTTGKELYAHDIDAPYLPASNLKLFTAATVLDRLGPTYSLKTTLAYDGKNLWLIGGGDPSCGDPTMAAEHKEKITKILDDWADQLQAAGINHISGSIYYDDRVLDHELVRKIWGEGDIKEWYGAPVAGLNLNDNCIDVTVIPSTDSEAVKYEVMPPTTNISIQNHAVSGNGETPDIRRLSDIDNEYEITGSITTRKTLESKPVTDPSIFFSEALRANLIQHGILVDGPTQPAPTQQPDSFQFSSVHEIPLSDALRRMLKDSQNLFAEDFCKLAGHDFAAKELQENLPGSWDLGFQAVQAFLKKNHIDGTEVTMVDGSGLAHENHVSGRSVTDLLMAMYRGPNFQVFYDALPISGIDGTISKRMRPIAGKVHAKTGFISGVRSLSGYVTATDGRLLAFCIIYNNIPGGVRPFERLQDETCELLSSYPALDYQPTTAPTTAPVN